MYILDLFSGIGGFSLGLGRAGFQTVAFCEINPFCRAVLKKHWPSVPCFDDIRTLSRASLAANGIDSIDVVCGGYPCQPDSVAGKRRGKDDDRYLWPEMFRLVRELRPAWVIGENVAGHISMGLDGVLADLEGEGYSARAFVIPACAVDAPHRRDRVWVVAYADGDGLPDRLRKHSGRTETDAPHPWKASSGCRLRRWQLESSVGRMADGIPLRVDRVKSLGNGLVPDIPETIGRAIKAIEEGLPA